MTDLIKFRFVIEGMAFETEYMETNDKFFHTMDLLKWFSDTFPYEVRNVCYQYNMEGWTKFQSFPENDSYPDYRLTKTPIDNIVEKIRKGEMERKVAEEIFSEEEIQKGINRRFGTE